PFPAYNEILSGGYWPGVHTTIASTGVGKSTFQFQTALHAVRKGIPVLYVGLELSEFQVALRSIAEAAGMGWSRFYTGRYTDRDIQRAREVMPALADLPLYLEFGTAHGWAPSNLVSKVALIRKRHPTGPLLV